MIKQYLTILNPDNNANDLQVCFTYDLGGFNPFTGRAVPRGYYLIITPVNVSGNCISFTAFSGSKYLLYETKRKSETARKAAAEKLREIITNACVETANKNNYIFDVLEIDNIIDNLINEGGR